MAPRPRERQSATLVAFEVAVIVPTLTGLSYVLAGQVESPVWALLLWAAIVAVVELIPVPVWRNMHMSMAFPLLMAVAFLYSPAEAAATALVGSFDPREFRREVSVVRALFNRSQVALSVLSASLVFHWLGSVESAVWILMGSALLAVATDYLVNMTLVSVAGYFIYGVPPLQMIRKFRIGRPSEFLVSYLGLGVLGVILALLHREVGFWSVATFLAPLVLARQMFFRSRALEEAHQELKEREQVLRALSNRMAEERQDERSRIAAYLHDDLAQLLFRLSLQVDIAKRHMQMEDFEATAADLDAIRETKNRTSEKIRALVRDLHRSPLGHAGLPEAVESFVEDVSRGLDTRFETDVADLPLPPPIALLAYHIVREGVMNSLRHGGPGSVRISLRQTDGSVELMVADDGSGFDPETPPPEGHFGLAMMRERAQVAGGSFSIESAIGKGTTITVRFPASWIQEPREDWMREPTAGQAVPHGSSSASVSA